MAKNSTAYFYNSGASIALSLTTSYQDLVTAQAEDSVLSVLVATNTNTTTAKTLTFADKDDKVLATVTIPANSGNSISNPPIDLLSTRLLLTVEYDAFGNSVIRLFYSGPDKIKAKVDSVSGGTVILFGKRNDY
jgi:hypothetical protein